MVLFFLRQSGELRNAQGLFHHENIGTPSAAGWIGNDHVLQSMDCAKLSLSCASPQKKLHLGSLGKASSKSLSDVTLSKDRARAGKPRKHWMNELSCMKSLAHTGEVKGQNLYKVYGQPVWEILTRECEFVESCRFICTGCTQKKSPNAATHLTTHSKQPLNLLP